MTSALNSEIDNSHSVDLSRVRVVLVNTSHPGNIGAVARAMKNMGLQQLSLVQPAEFPSAEATARASGADDILAKAQVVDTLEPWWWERVPAYEPSVGRRWIRKLVPSG